MKNGEPKGSTKSSKSSHQSRAPMVYIFEILGGYDRMCFFIVFWIGKKSARIQTFSDFDRQIEKNGWFGREGRCAGEEELGF